MWRTVNRGLVVGISSFFLLSCETPQFATVTIHDTPNQFVKLFHAPSQDNGEGFSHPAMLSDEEMQAVLKGVMVQEYHGSAPLPFMKNIMKGDRHRAFSDYWINFFAPKLVKGLHQATPEELVTFYETGQISPRQRSTTSGGVFVQGNQLHIFLSNYHLLTEIAQDNEDYEAPYRLRPLESIHPEPGRLEFDPAEFMVVPTTSPTFLPSSPLHVAVQYRKAAEASLMKPSLDPPQK